MAATQDNLSTWTLLAEHAQWPGMVASMLLCSIVYIPDGSCASGHPQEVGGGEDAWCVVFFI